MGWRFLVGMLSVALIGLGLLYGFTPLASVAPLTASGIGSGVVLLAVLVGFAWDVHAENRHGRRQAAERFEAATAEWEQRAPAPAVDLTL